MTTSATRWSWRLDAVFRSTSMSTSRYVTRPQFSIAPAANSGMATYAEMIRAKKERFATPARTMSLLGSG